TACHEIGHLLGLRHGGPDEIMAASYRGQRKIPNEVDAKKAQHFWGPAPPPMGTPTDQGGFGSGSGT
ncbi:MAG TPA: matrixin family metalloprotease, partial [Pirellulaceae bacterium]|nr:matrixin family metalloprotease [Pirellulaceae bacterium]